jgi:ABC-type bacteriocin/lantibiotic exporter with double-glycine peptidase domain
MAGCMLYWAEGSKGRTSCSFSNSDTNMLKMFISFLYNLFNITSNDIRVHINCYTNNGITVQQIEEYWQNKLTLPKSCFTKTTTDNLSVRSLQKKAKNKLLYGTVCLSVHSVQIVQHIYGAIQEYAGFNSEYCLD